MHLINQSIHRKVLQLATGPTMPYCLPPGLHPSLTILAWSLKIFDQQPLPSMQLLSSIVLGAMESTREGGVFSLSKEWTARPTL